MSPRITTMKALWMLWFCCLARADEDIPRIIAKVAGRYCKPDAAAATTRRSAGRRAAVGLSAITLRSVRAQAAAVGLEYDNELPVGCWVVLKPASSMAATQVAVQALREAPAAAVEVSRTAPGTVPGSANKDATIQKHSSSGFFEVIGFDDVVYPLGRPGLHQAAAARALHQAAAATAHLNHQQQRQQETAGRFADSDSFYERDVSGMAGLRITTHTRQQQQLEAAAAAAAAAAGARILQSDDYTANDTIDDTAGVAGGQQADQVPLNQSTSVGGDMPTNMPTGLPAECKSGSCQQWGLNRIKAPDLWASLGAGIPLPSITRKATIIDSGIDMQHYDLMPQVDTVNSRTFASNSSNQPPGGVAASSSHGTHVAGIAAGGWGRYGGQFDPNNIVGVAGPMYNQLVSCNVFGKGTKAYVSDVVRCLAHAVNVSAHFVVNLSLGGTSQRGGESEQLYRDALRDFCDAGGLVTVAAGNGVPIGSGCGSGPGGVDVPPCDYRGVDIADAGLQADNKTVLPNYAFQPSIMAQVFPDCVVAVANILQDPADTLAKSSNWGDDVMLAAPGDKILSDALTAAGENPWASLVLSGTSMAAPYVAGAAILLRNAFPDAAAGQVLDCLFTAADKTVRPHPEQPKTATIRGGVLNVKAAYECLQSQMDCTAQQLPSCVDASSGVADTACNSSTYFCLPVGGSTCRYNFTTPSTICDGSSGTTCSGTSAQCPTGPPEFCSKPPNVTNAVFQSGCSAYTPVGDTCSTTCLDGYSGDGFTAQCLPNGTWLKPEGPGCLPAGPVPVCAGCTGNGRCTTKQGCVCVPQTTGGGVCSCNATLGMREFTYQGSSGPESYCIWDIQWTRGTYLRSTRKTQVALEFALGSSQRVCPGLAGSRARRVVDGIVVDAESAVPCPAGTSYRLPRASGAGESCRDTNTTKLSRYIFNTGDAQDSKGRCYTMWVYRTDGFKSKLTLQFTN